MTRSTMTGSTIGVDIGGTKISVGLVDEHGSVTGMQTEPTPAQAGPVAIADVITRMVAIVEQETHDTLPVGVGSAGIIAPDGSVVAATSAIRDWGGFELARTLGSRLARPVKAINDVHAAALAESRFGAGRDTAGFLMVTVGTGVGGGVVLRGELQVGVSGTAGSVGHLVVGRRPARLCPCGQTDHVEAYGSGPAMELTYRELAGEQRSMREIAVAAERGDAHAIAALNDGAQVLATGLAGALAILDVDTVIIGGGVAAIGERYLARVRSFFVDLAMSGPSAARLVPAQLGTEAVIVGAALAARQ